MARTPAPSRSLLAQKIADFINANRLSQVFGGEVIKSAAPDGKRHYYKIGFSQARILDGEVHVWGPTHVAVLSIGPVGDGVDRMRGNVFGSVDQAIEYMRLRWVVRDQEAADKVPVKKPAVLDEGSNGSGS